MTDISTDVELKLAARPADLPELERALVGMAVHPVCSLISTYYDTPDLVLKRRGLTLRIRQQEGRLIQTVKAGDPAGADLLTRGEWEDEVAENRPDPDAMHSGSQLPEGVARRFAPALRHRRHPHVAVGGPRDCHPGAFRHGALPGFCMSGVELGKSRRCRGSAAARPNSPRSSTGDGAS